MKILRSITVLPFFTCDPELVLKTNKLNRKAIGVDFSVVCVSSQLEEQPQPQCAGRQLIDGECAGDQRVWKSIEIPATSHCMKVSADPMGRSAAERSPEVPYVGAGGSGLTSSHQAP